jgi:hypothetical protein
VLGPRGLWLLGIRVVGHAGSNKGQTAACGQRQGGAEKPRPDISTRPPRPLDPRVGPLRNGRHRDIRFPTIGIQSRRWCDSVRI